VALLAASHPDTVGRARQRRPNSWNALHCAAWSGKPTV